MASFPQLVTQSRIVVEYDNTSKSSSKIRLESFQVLGQPCLGFDFGQTEMAE